MVLAIIVIIAVVLVLIIAFITLMNSIKVASLKVDEAESGIDVALTKRYDVLTKMLEIIKEYEKFEKSTILETIRLRKGMSMQEKNVAEKEMNKALREINLTAEAYPQLTANTTFLKLQTTVMDTEEHLQASRRLYNANVMAYNTKVVTIPSSIVANMCGYRQREFFEAESSKRQDVEMKF